MTTLWEECQRVVLLLGKVCLADVVLYKPDDRREYLLFLEVGRRRNPKNRSSQTAQQSA